MLDLQLPGLDGFGVVEAIGAERMRALISVTAYDQDALRAFDALAPARGDRRSTRRARTRADRGRERAPIESGWIAW